MTWWIIGGAVLCVLVFVFTISLCRAAALGDQHLDRDPDLERMRKERGSL